jgi:hypothetical protein
MNRNLENPDAESGDVVEPRASDAETGGVDPTAYYDNDMPALAPEAHHPARAQGSGRWNGKARLLGAMVVGGIGGAAILGPLVTSAASPTPTAVAANPSATSGTDTDNDTNRPGNGPGGHVEATSDTAVVAKAIGITEAELQTALAGGQTVAAVAKAQNVPLQTVIDALVADGTSELAAQVANGTITQAQADAQKAEILQRATDQANGTFGGGRH